MKNEVWLLVPEGLLTPDKHQIYGHSNNRTTLAVATRNRSKRFPLS
jgi:hypothetical protein